MRAFRKSDTAVFPANRKPDTKKTSVRLSCNENCVAFCIRAEKEAKYCNFKSQDQNCKSEKIAARDQLILGISNNKIREEALKQSRNLDQIQREGMQIKNVLHGVAQPSGEAQLNKVG